jgi:hypothetical protein
MGLGELGNFAAYGFAPASLIAPLGCVSVIGNFRIIVYLSRFYGQFYIISCIKHQHETPLIIATFLVEFTCIRTGLGSAYPPQS